MKFCSYLVLLLTLTIFAPFSSQGASFLDKPAAVAIDVLTDNQQEQEFLPVDQAFVFDFKQQDEALIISWVIAPEYYLYRDKIQLVGKDVTIGEFAFPPSVTVDDEYFGTSHVFREFVSLTIPLTDIGANAEVKLRYQGCADAGLCYPPVKKVFPLISKPLEPLANIVSEKPVQISEQNQLANDLASGTSILTLLTFFALGLGLAFTPCVFPMYPILTGIIAGRCDKLSTKQGFALSMTYVQGMALTYTILGLVVASAGAKFQAYFQHPGVLIGLSVLFVVLSGSMFGWFELSLPASWQQKLNSLSNKQKGGSFSGVFLMGAISGLVASPCTTAPLSGVLLYVAQSNDLFLGGITLYFLSIGMGTPLLILGASGGKWLPKAGAWMEKVKVIFGFMLLAVPLILLDRIIDIKYTMTAAALLVVAFSAYLYNIQLNLSQSKAKTILTFASLGLLFGSGITIQQTWFAQNSPTAVASEQDSHGFINISSLSELNAQLKLAKQQQKPVMIDLYADWCVACKEFEKYTFTDETVKQQMSKFILLRADVTENNDTDVELLEAYSVLGLPTLMFFDLNSNEQTQQRVTGFMDAQKFNQHLLNLLN